MGWNNIQDKSFVNVPISVIHNNSKMQLSLEIKLKTEFFWGGNELWTFYYCFILLVSYIAWKVESWIHECFNRSGKMCHSWFFFVFKFLKIDILLLNLCFMSKCKRSWKYFFELNFYANPEKILWRTFLLFWSKQK